MFRSTMLGLAGVLVLIAGLVLIARADSLATRREQLDNGAWQDTTDSDRRTNLRQIGLGISVVGTIFLALGVRGWISVRQLPPVSPETADANPTAGP
jgi:uncharacterized membrane protein YbhN (UPF0104 family)